MKKTEKPKRRWVRIPIMATETHCDEWCEWLRASTAECVFKDGGTLPLVRDETGKWRRCSACKRAEVKP